MIFIFDDKSEPADIFADIPSEKAPAPPPPRSAGTTPLPVGESGVILESAPFGKKWVVIVLVALLLIGGGVGAFVFLRGKPAAEPAPAGQPTPEPAPEPSPEPSPEPTPAPTPEPAPEPEPAPSPEADADGDGLPDGREAQLGTNAQAVDTDGDGLTDREEVDVYNTDPLNPDTDGDTFMDGAEVRNGYDPNGPGKLLQIPANP